MEFELLKLNDLPFLNEIRNEAREFLHDNSYYTLSDSYDWFIKYNPEFYIIYNEKEKIGYFRTSNLTEYSIYIGCDIHKNYRGLGLGYLSYIEFIPFIMKRHNLKKIKLEVLSSNNRAINLYKKLGFKIIGETNARDNLKSIIMEYESFHK
jgi:RimJ/RimL family protein N-acetyltransferase